MSNGAIPREFMGDAGPSVNPGEDRALYGRATIAPTSQVEARSFQTLTVTYTVGKLGLDDTGAIRLFMRLVSDCGSPQMTAPHLPNFTTATTSGDGKIELTFDLNSGQRPWNRTLTARLRGGYLNPGDTVNIILGDMSQGSPGMEMATYVEEAFEFRIAADICATGHFEPLDDRLAVPIVPGPAFLWKAILPTLRQPNEKFRLGIKNEDLWGNPTGQIQANLRFECSLPVSGLPNEIIYGPNVRAQSFFDLQVEEEGTLWIKVFADNEQVATAGPLVIRSGDHSGYWGDMHGQTGESVGSSTARAYFDFARDMAFLDGTGHQANDFQVTNAFWAQLGELTTEYYTPGRFVTLPGYEWSGNTAVGGDHNVYFRNEGRPIYRSSHALLTDRSNLENDANTIEDLFCALENEDTYIYAHIGGRYANLALAHNPNIRTANEIHSAWGTFEWIMTDSFDLGHRSGVVANSDGHKGRPGASYPGAGTFGAYGGLTCFLTDKLDRDGFFDALKKRHHYATTGSRLYLDVSADLPSDSLYYETDPNGSLPVEAVPTTTAMMGDIIKAGGNTLNLSVHIQAAQPIERFEIRNGQNVLETIRPYSEAELGNRIRVIWHGAEYRGRGRNSLWRGRAYLKGASIRRFETINNWNPERKFKQMGSNQIVWDTLTTGNFMGFDIWLDDEAEQKGTIEISTNRGNLILDLEDIGIKDQVLDCGGLDRKLSVFRLPEKNPHTSINFERTITLNEHGDNPIWVSVITEDGFQAWSSPIYAFL